jgi:hypothetical protein
MGGKCYNYERCEGFARNNLKVIDLLGELGINDEKIVGSKRTLSQKNAKNRLNSSGLEYNSVAKSSEYCNLLSASIKIRNH